MGSSCIYLFTVLHHFNQGSEALTRNSASRSKDSDTRVYHTNYWGDSLTQACTVIPIWIVYVDSWTAAGN